MGKGVDAAPEQPLGDTPTGKHPVLVDECSRLRPDDVDADHGRHAEKPEPTGPVLSDPVHPRGGEALGCTVVAPALAVPAKGAVERRAARHPDAAVVTLGDAGQRVELDTEDTLDLLCVAVCVVDDEAAARR